MSYNLLLYVHYFYYYFFYSYIAPIDAVNGSKNSEKHFLLQLGFVYFIVGWIKRTFDEQGRLQRES